MELTRALPYGCAVNSSVVSFIPVPWLLNLSHSQPQIMLHKFLKGRAQILRCMFLPFPSLLDLDSLRSHFLGRILMFLKMSFLYLALHALWVSPSVTSCPTNIGGTYSQRILDKHQLPLRSHLAVMLTQSGVDR